MFGTEERFQNVGFDTVTDHENGEADKSENQGSGNAETFEQPALLY